MKLLSVFLFLVSVTVCGTQTVQEAKDLRTYLFTTNSYDYRVRPVANLSQPIDVYFMLSLMNILNVDTVQEVLYTSTLLYFTWNDTQLVWNSSDYGGLQTTHFPQSEVWKPDMTLWNSQSGLSGFGYAQQNVKITNEGTVEWLPFVVLDGTCPINIRYFPFDVQVCPLTFVASSYLASEVALHSFQSGFSLEDYETNAVWTILSTSFIVDSSDDDNKIVFTLQLKRKSMYTVLSVVFPILMLVILNLCVFFVPCDSGEKSGYAVTIFLSFAVFLTIVEATMPPNSDNISLFSVYIVLMTAMSTIITVLTQAMIRCSTFNEKKTKLPRWLIILAKLGKLKHCRAKCRIGSKTEVATLKEKTSDDGDIPKAYEDKTEALKTFTWNEAMNGLDCFLFIFFGLFSMLTSIIFLAVCAASG